MAIQTKKLKISSIDLYGNEIESHIIDISDIIRIHNISERIFDISDEDFKPTCDRISKDICPNICKILKEIIK